MLTPKLSSTFALATRYDRKPQELLDWHEHHDLSFCFVLKGNYQETTSRGSFTCRPGDVVIKPAAMRHQNTFGRLGALCLLLQISEETFGRSTGLVERELNGPVRDYSLARIGLELREELRVTDNLSAVMLEAIALRTVVSGLRLVRERLKNKAQMEDMRQSLRAGVAAGDLMSPHLTASEKKNIRRLFYEMEGCSMNRYVLQRRAFRAFSQLLNTNRSLADIAHRCGFYDQAHFTKVFAMLFGITPGRLRSRMN